MPGKPMGLGPQPGLGLKELTSCNSIISYWCSWKCVHWTAFPVVVPLDGFGSVSCGFLGLRPFATKLTACLGFGGGSCPFFGSGSPITLLELLEWALGRRFLSRRSCRGWCWLVCCCFSGCFGCLAQKCYPCGVWSSSWQLPGHSIPRPVCDGCGSLSRISCCYHVSLASWANYPLRSLQHWPLRISFLFISGSAPAMASSLSPDSINSYSNQFIKSVIWYLTGDLPYLLSSNSSTRYQACAAASSFTQASPQAGPCSEIWQFQFKQNPLGWYPGSSFCPLTTLITPKLFDWASLSSKSFRLTRTQIPVMLSAGLASLLHNIAWWSHPWSDYRRPPHRLGIHPNLFLSRWARAIRVGAYPFRPGALVGCRLYHGAAPCLDYMKGMPFWMPSSGMAGDRRKLDNKNGLCRSSASDELACLLMLLVRDLAHIDRSTRLALSSRCPSLVMSLWAWGIPADSASP